MTILFHATILLQDATFLLARRTVTAIYTHSMLSQHTRSYPLQSTFSHKAVKGRPNLSSQIFHPHQKLQYLTDRQTSVKSTLCQHSPEHRNCRKVLAKINRSALTTIHHKLFTIQVIIHRDFLSFIIQQAKINL